MILRRSRFDGLPAGRTSNCRAAFRSAATFWRNSRLASVSRYSVCATEAGPRTSLSARTSTSNSPPSLVTRSMSPIRTSRDALALCPWERIRPSSHARLASVRVLKKRAAHSQISILTPVTFSLSYKIRDLRSIGIRICITRPSFLFMLFNSREYHHIRGS